MDTTAVLPSRPIGDRLTSEGSPVGLAESSSVDVVSVLAQVHLRVARTFATYDAAEGGHARQYRALGAIAAALATHVAVEDVLLSQPFVPRPAATTPSWSDNDNKTTCWIYC
jgi:hypothetical protein